MISRVVAPAARAAARTQTARLGGQRFFCAATFLDVAAVEERVINVVQNFEKVDASKVNPASHFTNDLGLDSLDTVEMVMAFEEEFVLEIPDDAAEKIMSCQDAINFISAHPQAK